MDSLGRHPRQGPALHYPPPHSEGPCPSPISHSHGLCRPQTLPLVPPRPAPRIRDLSHHLPPARLTQEAPEDSGAGSQSSESGCGRGDGLVFFPILSGAGRTQGQLKGSV